MSHGFSGFQRNTFDFLDELATNNSKDWFDANRNRYETTWKSPALDLIAALREPMSRLDPPLKAEARINGSLRRINRDVRFSKDKSPYNARMHLIFWAGAHPNRSPAFHLVLHPKGVGFGAGVFGLQPAELATYRARIMDDTDRVALLGAIASAQAIGCEFDEPDLKKLPKGFECDADWEHLLRRKGFVLRTMENLPVPDWFHRPDCIQGIMKWCTATMPLTKWLSP